MATSPAASREVPAGLAFVALRRAGAVAAIDLTGRRVAARLEACPAARGLAWVGRTSSLFVACATGELAQLELTVQGAAVALAARTLSRPAPDLRDVLELPDGLLLTTFRDALVFKRSDDGTVTAQPGPVSTARTPMAMSSGGGAGGPPAQFDPHVAWRTVATAGGALMVHQHHQRGALGFGCSGYGGANGLGAVRSVLSRLTSEGVETLAEVPNAVLPVDLATSASGQRVAVAAAGSAVVWLRDAQGQLTMLPMPGQPTSVAFPRRAPLGGGARAGHAGAHRRRPGPAVHHAARRLGAVHRHLLFHRATGAGIACASCHPEAGEDGHTWVLPEGSRRTPTLRGALASTAPFHWGGEFQSLEALLSEVMVGRMRGVPQSPAREQALLTWMDAQPALPAPSWLDAQGVARGKALFEGKAGCVGCHAGAQGTNNATVDVGTGAALQVPRLVELARRAPYFHDGRIPTLAGRFEPAGGGDRHGNVSGLTATELEELITYLASR